jgi:hypothetical protein
MDEAATADAVLLGAAYLAVAVVASMAVSSAAT